MRREAISTELVMWRGSILSCNSYSKYLKDYMYGNL